MKKKLNVSNKNNNEKNKIVKLVTKIYQSEKKNSFVFF